MKLEGKEREDFILKNLGLVKYIAGRMAIYFFDYIKEEDLVSYGIFGLIDAIDKFDETKKIKFETYASIRIRGAMIDAVRNDDWIPRSVRKKAKLISNAKEKFEIENGRTPSIKELSKILKISESELSKFINSYNLSNVLSLNEILDNNLEFNFIEDYNSFESSVERRDMVNQILNCIKDLNIKQQNVIIFYYYENMTLKQISNAMNLSESRISQIHKEAISKIKNKILCHFAVNNF